MRSADCGLNSAFRNPKSTIGSALRLTDLNLRISDDTYTGRGATQEDGRLIVVLTDGTREMRVSGPLAKPGGP